MVIIKYWLRLCKESLNDKLLKDALIDNINMMNTVRIDGLHVSTAFLRSLILFIFFIVHLNLLISI